jgi:hypothetical protein
MRQAEATRADMARPGSEYCQKVASLYCGSADFDSATGTIRPKAKQPGITAPGPARNTYRTRDVFLCPALD